jgi:tetratricopeptide (TPR) repeat protein
MPGAKVAKYSLLILLIGMIIALWYSALHESKEVQRDIHTLFNFYYRYKATNPLKAKEALDLILQQEPNNPIATRAIINWYLEHGDTHSALKFLEQHHQQDPSNAYIDYKLMKLYISLNEHDKAKAIYKNILSTKDSPWVHRSKIIYEAVYPMDTQDVTSPSYLSFIEPLHFKPITDFKPLYEKIQSIMRLQPDSAKRALHLILSINQNEREAYMLLGYIYLQEKQLDNALSHFIKAFTLKPTASLALQLGYIYAELKNSTKATEFFNYAATNGSGSIKQQSLNAINALAHQLPINISTPFGGKTNAPVQSPEDKLWNTFYQNKKAQIQLAWQAIEQLLKLNPTNIRALKEAAYFATAQKDNLRAIGYWKNAYAIEPNPEYALSIAYLYDGIDRKFTAFHYFDLAAKTSNKAVHDKAEVAMTNMGGSQFKFLPKPYFIELYTAPFYFSRFGLGVFPTILRTGVTLSETYHTEVYLSHRRTKDSRSGTTLQGLIVQSSISQIFEDNAAIYAAGVRASPWPKVPVQAFFEAGSAEDLIYRNRPKWRSDVRGGLVYFNAWGAKPTYTDSFKLQWKWVSTLYADFVYYSRYNNNIIGTAWYRPGFRVATFQSASLDLYLANYYIFDKNREFFNNTYSLGPGIAFRPTNRVNMVVRLESLQGYYIPVHSPSPNPYGSKYRNKIAMVEFYMRF